MILRITLVRTLILPFVSLFCFQPYLPLPPYALLLFEYHIPRSTDPIFFQIEENTRALEYLGQTWGSQSSLESLSTQGSATSERKRISSEKWKQGARKTLLQWVTNALPKLVFYTRYYIYIMQLIFITIIFTFNVFSHQPCKNNTDHAKVHSFSKIFAYLVTKI